MLEFTKFLLCHLHHLNRIICLSGRWGRCNTLFLVRLRTAM